MVTHWKTRDSSLDPTDHRRRWTVFTAIKVMYGLWVCLADPVVKRLFTEGSKLFVFVITCLPWSTQRPYIYMYRLWLTVLHVFFFLLLFLCGECSAKWIKNWNSSLRDPLWTFCHQWKTCQIQLSLKKKGVKKKFAPLNSQSWKYSPFYRLLRELMTHPVGAIFSAYLPAQRMALFTSNCYGVINPTTTNFTHLLCNYWSDCVTDLRPGGEAHPSGKMNSNKVITDRKYDPLEHLWGCCFSNQHEILLMGQYLAKHLIWFSFVHLIIIKREEKHSMSWEVENTGIGWRLPSVLSTLLADKSAQPAQLIKKMCSDQSSF